jgi:hypothetical protein
MNTKQITTTSALVIISLLGIAILGMWGCPQYSVYQSRKEGEALLAHAQSAKEVAVATARAKMESAAYEAQADTIRARGIAQSNRIIGESLKDNPAYLQWLWIDQLKDTKDQIIYVPSGQMGLPIQEATRLQTPLLTQPIENTNK